MNRIDFLLSPSLHYWIDSITFILFYSLDGRKLECLMPSATKWTFQPVWISPQGEIPIIHVGPKKKKIIKRMLLLETLWPPPSWEKAETSMCARRMFGFSIHLHHLFVFVRVDSFRKLVCFETWWCSSDLWQIQLQKLFSDLQTNQISVSVLETKWL